MWLFRWGNGFRSFEQQTGWREYWVWIGKDRGWVHRSHIFSAEDSKSIETAAPLNRVYTPPKLADDYGTEAYNRRKAESLHEPAKEFVKTIQRGKRTVRVIK